MSRDIVVVLKNELDKLLREYMGYKEQCDENSMRFIIGKLYGINRSVCLMLTSDLITASQYREFDNYFSRTISKTEVC